MAVVITENLTNINVMDATTGLSETGVAGAPALNAGIGIEGTNCVECGSGVGENGLIFDLGSTDMTDDHVFVWMMTGQKVQSLATGGLRIRISTSTDGLTNFGEYYVGGNDTVIGPYEAWHCWVVDLHRPFDNPSGTPPALTAVIGVGGVIYLSTSDSRTECFWDWMKRGSGIVVKGGTSGAKGNSDEIASNDLTNGRGTFKKVGGLFYILGELEIGDTANVASYFLDTNNVWNFEDAEVSASFHKIKFVGHVTPVNSVEFGTEVGSGITASGSGGNFFQAGGAVPFRVEAIDANVTVNLFGCNMLNPIALRKDYWRSVQSEDSGTGFTDVTRDTNAGGNSNLFPSTQALNDAVYFGHTEIFSEIYFEITGVKGGTWTLTWEYYNGSSWVSLTDVTDSTSSFASSGTKIVIYAIPDDWATVAVNSRTFYYIRGRISSFTSSGVNPLIGVALATMGGRVRWEQANAKAVSGTWTNMDTVRVRNGAILRKITLVDSVAPVRSAALDLGDADPTADSVRDITIIGANKGILLKKAGAGNVTYNFRNIKFAGNTNDVRVDFPSGSTVTINILNGGDTPTIDNVNGSTVVVSNPVTVAINVKDNLGVNLQNARVLLEASDGTGDFPFEETIVITRSGSTATVAHTAHGLATGGIAVIRGADQPEYNGPHTITVTTANTYTYTVSGAPATPATGTLISSGAMINALTNASGNVTGSRTFVLDQPVKGTVRKSTSSPRFKSFPLLDTIDNALGLSINIQMVIDE